VTNAQLAHLVTLADGIREAQRVYASDRSPENGKAVGKATAAYDAARKEFDAGAACVYASTIPDTALREVEGKLIAWAEDKCEAWDVVDLILRLAARVEEKPGF
jgi:hypothetical protein